MDQYQIITIILTAASVVLTGAYVVFTLIIVRKTIESIDLARQQMAANQQQSQDALATSEKQSKAAIDTVHEQIVASENQAREALYNQHKPVLVPMSTPVSRDARIFTMQILNKGAGVALNAWGLFTMKGFPLVHYFTQTYFLVPDRDEQIAFTNGDILYRENIFENTFIFPRDDAISGISTDVRLMITYNDIFGNNYLVVFDHSDLGWRQIDLKRVEKRLDEYASKKRSSL